MTLLPIDEQYFTSHQVTKSLCSIRSFDKLIKEKSIINISYFKVRMTNYLCISQKERKLYRQLFARDNIFNYDQNSENKTDIESIIQLKNVK
jgi:hypothetical protein